MGLNLRRRSVYAGTIVAMMALIAGLAMASFVSTVTTGGQNAYSVTSAIGTSYATGVPSVNLVWTTASACTTTGTVSSAGPTANAFIAGQVACQTATPDWFEELSFPGTALFVNPIDAFAVTVGPNAPVLFSVQLTTTSGHAITTNVFYEVGSSASSTTSDVGITGD
ncbi:MAG: hypothetical protein L3K01_03150 [Thermoplasmata archaeon]|nr:hypothetical protein [Thermoplasmata archaeon]MCI4332717.1 hypothetical protein [Thermoplasmata archaeon]